MQRCLPTLLAALLLPLFGADDATTKWGAMDYGPTLACTLQVDKQYVLRALIVRLDPARQTYLCYDLETMRVAAVWSGGFIDYHGVLFNGTHHEQPKPKGTMLMVNQLGPGWSKDGSLEDPRPLWRAAYNVPTGASEMTREGQPMPADWVHLNGHYLHEQQVVLSYTVNGCQVRELPEAGDGALVTRTITIAASPIEQRVQLAPMGVRCALVKPAPGAELANDGVNQFVTLAPATAERTFVVAIGEGTPKATAAPLETLMKGGPARWKQTVTTHGTLGSGDGPYVVDTLTAPDDNPWKSWIRFGGIDFFPDGKSAALCTWSGDVWIVSGIDGGLGTLTWKRFATGLYQPLGLKIVDGLIYLTCRDHITRLHDLDGDGEADYYENFNSDMYLTRHFHEFALDLQTDAAGNFYFAKGCTPGRGGPNFDLWSIHNGCFFRLSPDGRDLHVVARGLRGPNGIGVGPHGELVSSDNQGSWVPVCPINRIHEGAFVGVPDGVPGEPKPTKREDPLIWLPYDRDNSSGGEVWVPDQRWGAYAGNMLQLSYGKSCLFAVMIQDIGAAQQAAIVKFPLEFATGIMRSRFNAGDGQLYVCGLRGWQTNGGRDGAFQRVRYTGKPVHMPIAFAATRSGIEITFSCALDRASAEDLGNYHVEQYNIIWSAKYGSPEMSVLDPKKQAHDPVPLAAAHLKEDGRTVVLDIPGIHPVNCMVTKLKILAADGAAISTEVDNTINLLP
jgi:hypothetical protein